MGRILHLAGRPALWIALLVMGWAAGMLRAGVREAEMSGYLLVPNERVPRGFNGGFSMYVAAWPLVQQYPGHRFQTGLFGTWMFAQHDGPVPKFYSDVEGGLGWWRDTRFPTETPKFIMGGAGRHPPGTRPLSAAAKRPFDERCDPRQVRPCSDLNDEERPHG